jgi:hypothetical protein
MSRGHPRVPSSNTQSATLGASPNSPQTRFGRQRAEMAGEEKEKAGSRLWGCGFARRLSHRTATPVPSTAAQAFAQSFNAAWGGCFLFSSLEGERKICANGDRPDHDLPPGSHIRRVLGWQTKGIGLEHLQKHVTTVDQELSWKLLIKAAGCCSRRDTSDRQRRRSPAVKQAWR